MPTSIDIFDHDALHKLAQQDPEQLEAMRLREVENLISSAPDHMQRRLRGLQFQIDCERRKHRTPLGACLAISQMMMRSLHELNDALCGEHSPPAHEEQAVVLPFARAAGSGDT